MKRHPDQAIQPLAGQREALHPSWKGSRAGYSAFHKRLVARFGRPQECRRCGTTGPGRTYDWANLNGRYDDIEDYERMCRSCHRKYDNWRDFKWEDVRPASPKSAHCGRHGPWRTTP